MTASPEELRLLLLDGALRFTRQGRDGMDKADIEATYAGLSQAKAILMELINALRPEIAPELCERMTALYIFMYKRLIDANLEHSVAMIDEVIGLLEYERETWVMLMDKLRQEREAMAAGLPFAETPANSAPAVTPAASAGGATVNEITGEGQGLSFVA